MSNLNRHKDYYLRGWRSNIEDREEEDADYRSLAINRLRKAENDDYNNAFISLGNVNANNGSTRSNSRTSGSRSYYYYGEQPVRLI